MLQIILLVLLLLLLLGVLPTWPDSTGWGLLSQRWLGLRVESDGLSPSCASSWPIPATRSLPRITFPLFLFALHLHRLVHGKRRRLGSGNRQINRFVVLSNNQGSGTPRGHC